MMAATAAAPVLAVHRSRKLIPEFRLHRPRSAGEAVAMHERAGPGAVFMAGGIDVVNRLKFGGAVIDLIYLGGVAGLDLIEPGESGVRLGSLVTHDQLATSPLVQSRIPELARAWPEIANIRIRCKATIGGNIMAGDSAYDFALAAMAADAQLDFLGSDGDTRVVQASALGAASEGGLMTAINFPSATACRLVFDRSLRPVASLVLGLDLVRGKIAGGRLAIGCAYAAPLVVPLPIGEPVPSSELAGSAESLAQDIASRLPEPISDRHAGAIYRRRMIAVLLRRNLAALPRGLA